MSSVPWWRDFTNVTDLWSWLLEREQATVEFEEFTKFPWKWDPQWREYRSLKTSGESSTPTVKTEVVKEFPVGGDQKES